MDLVGPFARSDRGHSYLFTLIDHLTGFIDAYPIAHKTGETIADILHRDIFPRYGPVEVVISDNGREFVNNSVDAVCKAYGVEHRTTTPYHPQSNSKIERAHRTLKDALSTLITSNNSQWEKQLGPALLALRTTASTVTGYSPYQALYGRTCRLPTTIAVNPGMMEGVFDDDRVAALARIWQQAQQSFQQQREANEAQQAKKRLGKPLNVGDSVIVLIEGHKASFKTRWDARWQVIRAKDPVYWIRHLPTGRERVLNREKLHWVPADVDWSLIPAKVTSLAERPAKEPRFVPPVPQPMDFEETPPSNNHTSRSTPRSISPQSPMGSQSASAVPGGSRLSTSSGSPPVTPRSASPEADNSMNTEGPAALGESAVPSRYPRRKRSTTQDLESYVYNWDLYCRKRTKKT